MNIHKNIQLKFYDYLTSDISEIERVEIEQHLSSCPLCSQEYQEFKTFFESSKIYCKNPTEELSDEYWMNFIDNVDNRINSLTKYKITRKSWLQSIFTLFRLYPKMSFALGVSFLIIISTVLILSIRKNEPAQTVENLPAMVSSHVNVDERVGQYLKKSKVLLVSLSNMESDNTLTDNLSTEQTISRQLVNEAEFLKMQPIDFQAKRLIRDLVKIQEQLATTDIQNSETAFHSIRRRIYENNLLFKVRMAESIYGGVKFASTSMQRGGDDK